MNYTLVKNQTVLWSYIDREQCIFYQEWIKQHIAVMHIKDEKEISKDWYCVFASVELHGMRCSMEMLKLLKKVI